MKTTVVVIQHVCASNNNIKERGNAIDTYSESPVKL